MSTESIKKDIVITDKKFASAFEKAEKERQRSYHEADLKRWNKIETEDTVVCPYCFEPHELHTDYFEGGDFEDEWECSNCEKEFKVQGEIRYEFWSKTRKME